MIRQRGRRSAQSKQPLSTGLLCLLLIVPAVSVLGQTASNDSQWSGHVQCEIRVQSDGYTSQETQTWTLTGGPPTPQGSIPVYPAMWTATGQGTVQRPTAVQTLAATWTNKVAPMSAPLAIFVRASDNRLIVRSMHVQLRADGAVTGTRQMTGGGVAPSQTSVQLAAYEWQLPAIEDVATSTNVSGSGTVTVAGSLMPLQAAATSATAACTWQFSKGTTASPAASSGPTARTPSTTLGPSPNLTTGVNINPSTAQQATSLVQVMMTGVNTVWDDTVRGDFGPGVRILRVSRFSATSIRFSLGIDPAAALGPRTVTVGNTTSGQFVNPVRTTLNITSPRTNRDFVISPNAVQQGQALSVAFKLPTAATGVNLLNDPLQVAADCGSDVRCSVVSATGSLVSDATVSMSITATATAALGTHLLVVSSIEKTMIDQVTISLPVYYLADVAVTANTSTGAGTAPPSSAGSTLTNPIGLNDVAGDLGSDVDMYSASWVASIESDYYRFHLARKVSSLSPPPLRALVTIAGLQSGADFDVRVYWLGGSAPYTTITHTGSSPAVLCFSSGAYPMGPDVVLELRSRSPGPYTMTIAGNTASAGCISVQVMTAK